MADTIAEAKAEQAAVQLFDQLPSIASQLKNLKGTVERATGFKNIVIANAPVAKRNTMLGEVSTEAATVWSAVEPDLIAVLDVVAAMLPNPGDLPNMHTRNSLLDSLKS